MVGGAASDHLKIQHQSRETPLSRPTTSLHRNLASTLGQLPLVHWIAHTFHPHNRPPSPCTSLQSAPWSCEALHGLRQSSSLAAEGISMAAIEPLATLVPKASSIVTGRYAYRCESQFPGTRDLFPSKESPVPSNALSQLQLSLRKGSFSSVASRHLQIASCTGQLS